MELKMSPIKPNKEEKKRKYNFTPKKQNYKKTKVDV